MKELPRHLIVETTVAAIKRQIHELVISGLFYSCVKDITICTFCGLALRNWYVFFTERTSAVSARRACHYPLLEHTYWNSNCTLQRYGIDRDVMYIPQMTHYARCAEYFITADALNNV